ncbi:transcriptional regulator AraC family [Vibrio maritimus]|uniref:Transcriptional regulator AraC family n=1 Tax=Vibrio maritimus TaxID=990268 RepID=A0A090S2F6_9VIBR|nr:transcriptional regulator AraC family [Vibrio maritimus]
MVNMSNKINVITLPKGNPCQIIDSAIDDEGGIIGAHRHDYFEIIWCLDDIGKQSIDFVEYPSKKGRFFTIAPGQVHETAELTDNYRMMIFSTDFLENRPRHQRMFNAVFRAHDDQQPYFDTSDDGLAYFEPLFALLLDEFHQPQTDWDLIESLLTSFLRYLLRFSIDTEDKQVVKDTRMTKVLELIECHYRSQRHVQFYADALSITSKRLNELTKKHVGKTITRLLHDRILLEANRDLLFSTKTVKTIALDLGFDDPSYFGRFYRGQMGESPAEFRKRTSE